MATQGGPARPVSVLTSPVQHEGGAAIPVAVVSDGRATVSGPAQPVIVVTNPSRILGGPAIPIVAAPAGARVAGGPALRVYVVSGSFVNPVLAYTNKVLALGPIAYWPMAEPSGSVAFDATPNARNGAYTGVTLGQTGIGDGRTAAGFDGATSFNNVFGASLAAAFNGLEGTIACWAKVSGAGVWTDGVARRIATIQADGSNRAIIFKGSTNNQIGILYQSGGGTTSTKTFTQSPTAFFHIALTWSRAANQVKLYINGAQQDTTGTISADWAGLPAATTTAIGAISTTPTGVWNGTLAHAAFWASALSAAQIATLAVVP